MQSGRGIIKRLIGGNTDDDNYEDDTWGHGGDDNDEGDGDSSVNYYNDTL